MVDPKTIATIKESLIERKAKLEKELSAFAKKDEHVKDDYKADFPEYGDKEDENANEIAQYSTNLSLEQSLEKTLQDINKALESMEKGTYGVCKYCSKEIGEQRLLARPVSSACMECKQKLTSKNV